MGFFFSLSLQQNQIIDGVQWRPGAEEKKTKAHLLPHQDCGPSSQKLMELLSDQGPPPAVSNSELKGGGGIVLAG